MQYVKEIQKTLHNYAHACDPFISPHARRLKNVRKSNRNNWTHEPQRDTI